MAKPFVLKLVLSVILPLVLSLSVQADSRGPAQSELIEQHIRAAWEARSLSPSREADDGKWCRRVYLDLLGRAPSLEELTAFLDDRSNDKRAALVDRLLGDEYLEEYARNFTTIWTNILIGRTGGADADSPTNRMGMKQYLRRSFQKNKPFDQIMEELVTATGSGRPGDDDYNGAVNFLAEKFDEGGIQATAKTSQIFLGTAVQCTQCHNHPFNDQRQNQFWEMNAFFRQARAERIRSETMGEMGGSRIVDRNFRGEGGHPDKAEIYYELRNGKLKVAYPVFIDGTALSDLYVDRGEDFGDSGYVSDINRREELAKLIRTAPEFPRAIVNRVWGHFFTYGFTKPVDDMGPHNPASHPVLLDELAQQFRDSSFDIKRLMRWIVLSEPYSLSSRAGRGNADDEPALGATPMFSRFYTRQMEAEQLYETLLVVTGADKSLSYAERERVKQDWLNQFNRAFGNDENGEDTSFNGSIPQALVMMNGPLIKKATKCSPGSFLHAVATDSSLSNPERVRRLYLAAVARTPDRNELALCNRLLVAHEGETPKALEDIWWALLNSNEFILNH